jgi:hypothetical protein
MGGSGVIVHVEEGDVRRGGPGVAVGGSGWPAMAPDRRARAASCRVDRGAQGGGANRWATTKVSGGCTGGQVGLSSIVELTEGGDEAAMVARNTVRGAAG